jgi:hypothetical protein
VSVEHRDGLPKRATVDAEAGMAVGDGEAAHGVEVRNQNAAAGQAKAAEAGDQAEGGLGVPGSGAGALAGG